MPLSESLKRFPPGNVERRTQCGHFSRFPHADDDLLTLGLVYSSGLWRLRVTRIFVVSACLGRSMTGEVHLG